MNSNSYNPTFSPTSCPSIVTASSAGATDSNSAEWLAPATPLPPSPNAAVCACEMSQLQCVSSSTDQTTYQDDFDYICGAVRGACDGINTNVTGGGTYGAYGMCSAQQKLSFAMNKYYQAQSGSAKSSACDFSGRARTQSTSAPTGSCSSLLQAAGTNGQGTVPPPSGNAAQQSSVAAGGGGSSGGGSGGSGGSGSSQGAGSHLRVPTFDAGLLQLSAYIICAVVTGAGMIIL